MRLDRYLKLTRIIKRREVAKVLISENSILVNNKKVKPSYGVKIGDQIKLTLGRKIIEIEVIGINEVVNKKSDKMYKIINNI